MCLSFRHIRQPEQEEHRPWIMCPVATLPQGRSNNMANRNFVRRKLEWILPEERSTNLEVENENLRDPKTEGDPPRLATAYSGTKHPVRPDDLPTDQASGERPTAQGQLQGRHSAVSQPPW